MLGGNQIDIILSGDSNIDWLGKEDCFTKRMSRIISKWGLRQIVAEITRIIHDCISYIDWVVTDGIGFTTDVLTFRISKISDHDFFCC